MNSRRLLLVEPDEADLKRMTDALSGPDFTLTIARTFEDAVRDLSTESPDLLVTGLRLDNFNGLHLVLRSRFLDAFVPAILVGLPTDYSQDVAQLGVPFVPKPASPDVLLAAVEKELRHREPRAVTAQRRWPRKHAQLAATVADSTVDVSELSYGGFRLEAKAPVPAGVGAPIVVTFPTLGFSVTGVPRWTKTIHEGAASWCGVEILDLGMGPATSWRDAVDSLR